MLAIICQGIFGYLTVSLKLHPLIVTTHLFGAMIVASIFLIIYLRSLKYNANYDALVANRNLIFIGFGLIAFQIFLGAWTSTNYAARACLDLPLCQGSYCQTLIFQKVLICSKLLVQITCMVSLAMRQDCYTYYPQGWRYSGFFIFIIFGL